ncbi:hypothetical protein [Sulfuracidifex tepidarius]|uniref:Uncharacterized protein n=1 Tax=Sulfuracidifex tepidarius TaxID=1294262 RepID=A0A510DYE2_9CREN|nr:hypothetical protein [Sulfuracidifex tepidarius]BBG25253.1 hypothetical protein IC006_2588 [Sulfuracidifex tepidarius]BBG28047.1 hypothetical protein IC007_2602 [Sulfuracidifex tepidarius]
MNQVFSLSEKILSDMIKWYGTTFRAAAIDIEEEVPVLVIVLKEVSGVSFTSRGEISWFFMRRALKDTPVDRDTKIQVVIFSDKEARLSIPYLIYVSMFGKVLYDPDKLFSKEFRTIEESEKKILLLADIKKGEVVDIEQQ